MQYLLKPCQQCHKPMNGGVYRAAHICPHCYFEHEGGKRSRARKVQQPAAAVYEEPQMYEAPQEYEEPKMYAEEVAEAEAEEPAVVAPSVAISTDAIVAAEEEVSAPAVLPVIAPPAAAEKPTPAPLAKQTPPQPAPVKAPAPAVTNGGVTLTTKPLAEHDILALVDDVTAESVITIELTPELFKDGKFVGAKSDAVLEALKQGKREALAKLRVIAENLDANMVTDIAIKNGMKMLDAKTADITVNVAGKAVIAEVSEDAYEV